MNDNSESSGNIIEVVEAVLDVPFTTKELEKLDLTPQKTHELAIALHDYYAELCIPSKKISELRPFIDLPLRATKSPGMDFVFDFKSSVSDRMTGEIKKYLLYCHSVCIRDPLPYLLDYYRLAPNSKYALAQLPAVKALLVEYTKLAKLIRKNIIIPISDEVYGFHSGRALEIEERDYLQKQLPHLHHVVPLLAGIIREEQWRISKLNQDVDFYFTHPDFIEVFRELLRFSETKFTSRDIEEPFSVGLLGGVDAINPNAISIEDITRIRSDEELFADWRSFLGRVFEKLYVSRNDYTDLEGEFCNTLQSEVLYWKDKLERRKEKSSVTKQMLASTDKILIGLTAGAVTGFVTAGPVGSPIGAVTGGIIGGVLPPALESIKGLIRTAYERPNTLSLRNHFLAVGANEHSV